MRHPSISGTLIAAFLLLLLSACASIRPIAPEVNLVDIRIGDLTLSHANLLADLRIYNPNPVAINLKGVSYNFLLNNIQVASGQSLKDLRIGAGEYGETTLRISTGYLNLLQFTSGIRSGDAIKYAIDGRVNVGGFRTMDAAFPFRREGEIDPQKLSPTR